VLPETDAVPAEFLWNVFKTGTSSLHLTLETLRNTYWHRITAQTHTAASDCHLSFTEARRERALW
jgi:hypothetical protein